MSDGIDPICLGGEGSDPAWGLPWKAVLISLLHAL